MKKTTKKKVPKKVSKKKISDFIGAVRSDVSKVGKAVGRAGKAVAAGITGSNTKGIYADPRYSKNKKKNAKKTVKSKGKK